MWAGVSLAPSCAVELLVAEQAWADVTVVVFKNEVAEGGGGRSCAAAGDDDAFQIIILQAAKIEAKVRQVGDKSVRRLHGIESLLAVGGLDMLHPRTSNPFPSSSHGCGGVC